MCHDAKVLSVGSHYRVATSVPLGVLEPEHCRQYQLQHACVDVGLSTYSFNPGSIVIDHWTNLWVRNVPRTVQHDCSG